MLENIQTIDARGESENLFQRDTSRGTQAYIHTHSENARQQRAAPITHYVILPQQHSYMQQLSLAPSPPLFRSSTLEVNIFFLRAFFFLSRMYIHTHRVQLFRKLCNFKTVYISKRDVHHPCSRSLYISDLPRELMQRRRALCS